MSASPAYAGMYPDAGPHVSLCMACGSVHTDERRRHVIRRMLPCTQVDVRDAWSHLWPDDATGRRMLARDLHAMGAVRDNGGVWRMP